MTEQNINLMEKFIRASSLLARYHFARGGHRGPFGNPHRGQGRILSLLKKQPEMTQKELSYLLDIRSQSLGELLMKLERNGFILRTASEEDRRVMKIKLTEKGAEAADKAAAQPEEEDFFSFLSAEEQETLAAALDKLIEELEERMEDDIPNHNFNGVFAGLFGKGGPRFPGHGHAHGREGGAFEEDHGHAGRHGMRDFHRGLHEIMRTEGRKGLKERIKRYKKGDPDAFNMQEDEE